MGSARQGQAQVLPKVQKLYLEEAMTKAQCIEHKIGNALRRERLLGLYYKVKPSSKGWIANPGFIQRSKYSTEPEPGDLARRLAA